MAQRALVAYSSRTGTTEEIARAVAESLIDRGVDAVCEDVESVKDVAAYDLIVLGSPIYGGALREAILTFVEAHELVLMDKRVAFFTCGMLPTHSPEQARGEHEGAIELACLRAPGVKPYAHAIFAGAYTPSKVDFVSRKLMERKNSPVGDFRDWDAIRSWASGLAERMAA